MTDPAEDICEAAVEYALSLTAPTVSLTAKIRQTDNPLGEIEFENTDLTVLFHVASEEATKQGKAAWLEDFTISMLVVRKLAPEFPMARLMRYVRELKAAFRGHKLAGYTFSRDETPVKFDAIQRKELGQFVSISKFTYTGFPACS